jgi:hypothetical protein
MDAQNAAHRRAVVVRGAEMSIDRIVFTGDIFRTTEAKEPIQLQNVFWLFRTMAWQVARVAGILPEICFRGANVQYGKDAIELAYRCFGLEPSLESWASLFWRHDIPDEAMTYFEQDYANALVVAIEMPPILQAYLDRIGAPWIDVSISPLRFLEDLLVSFRFSHHFSTASLGRFAVSPDDIGRGVARVREHFRGGRNTAEFAGSAIFFAQTERDRTLIANGKFFDLEVAINEIAIRLNGRRLLLKPHPWAPANPIIDLCRSRLGGQILDTNTYEILSSDAELAILTISSSVSAESNAFLKETHAFNPRVLEFAYSGLTTYDAYRGSSFWVEILGRVLDVASLEEFSESFKENRLRDELGYFSVPRNLWEAM